MKLLKKLLLIIVFMGSIAAFAQNEESLKYPLNCKIAPHSIMHYKVETSIRQKEPEKNAANKTGLPINADFTTIMRHKYANRGSSDKMLPLEIKALSCNMVYSGQTFSIAPDMPTLSLLIDNNFFVKNIFGLRPTDMEVKNPGVTYSSLIMFFYPHTTEGGIVVGDQWDYSATLPAFNQIYKFKNKFVSIETIDNIRTAKIEQLVNIFSRSKNSDGEVVQTPAKYDVTAITNYSIDAGVLVKSVITVKNMDENPITMTYTISKHVLPEGK